LALAALAGPLGAIALADVPPVGAAVVGAVCGAVVLSCRRLVLACHGLHNLAGALAIGIAPIAALGTLIYFLEKLLLG
jgi:hypothetical protein